MRSIHPPHHRGNEHRPPGGLVGVTDLVHRYGSRNPVDALGGVTVTFPAGSFTAVVGPSGSGKSTLLHCAAGLDRPTSGRVHWDGVEISSLPERRLAVSRRRWCGFVFQAFNLLPAMTVAQNVILPRRLDGERVTPAAAKEALGWVGLRGKSGQRPGELSGGERQRVAIARSLIADPPVLFADEPTGALDRASGARVMDLLRRRVDQLGRTCVMVTHDPVAAGYADVVLVLRDGRLTERLDRPTIDVVAAMMGSR